LLINRRRSIGLDRRLRPDEKSIPPAQNKRTQVRENAHEKIFPEARIFKYEKTEEKFVCYI